MRHLDAIGKSFELVGADLAFRTQQSSVARLDNIGTFVDSENGHLDGPCGFSYTAATACVVSSNAAWVTQQFRPQAGRVGLEFLVTPSANGMDAVVGAAAGEPEAFSDLAAIVRFRPDGSIDARNGSAYAAEATATYLAGRQYRVSLDIDQPSGTYSASVTLWNDAPIVIAQNYAFRTEQTGVTLLDHVGQFVDETDGALQVCMLTVVR